MINDCTISLTLLAAISANVFLSVRGANNSSIDGGYLANCNLEILDITITSADTDKLRLWIFSDPNHHHSYNMSRAAAAVRDPAFRGDFRTIVFCHGVFQGPNDPSTRAVIAAHFNKGLYNVMMLDASSVISLPYTRSARFVRYIGARLGRVLVQLTTSGLSLQTLDLVGHGLGAHILGYAGKAFKKSTGRSLPRIVALDPAGPCFRNVSEAEGLSKSDADFVQVLHTNGGSIGLMNAVGHADFYINGGRWQLSEYGKTCPAGCSHSKVLYFWSSAVQFSNKFYGIQCKSVEEMDHGGCAVRGRKMAVMGPAADPKTRGVFYVGTLYGFPYFIERRDMFPPDHFWRTYTRIFHC